MSIPGYIWMAIKVLLFGGTIALQPSFATLTPKYQAFVAPSGSKIEAINELATLNLQTDELERMTMGQLTADKNIEEKLSLTSISAFLVSRDKKICQLKFVGFGMTEKYNDAIYRCDGRDISGMQFTAILMNSSHPIQIKSIRWKNAGK